MANERGFAMGVAVRLREDYAAAQLRGLARQSHDAGQTRRLLALAAIYDGGSRSAAAQIGGVGLQTIRDWVLDFNARGPDGLIDGKAPGKVPLLDARHGKPWRRSSRRVRSRRRMEWCAGG